MARITTSVKPAPAQLAPELLGPVGEREIGAVALRSSAGVDERGHPSAQPRVSNRVVGDRVTEPEEATHRRGCEHSAGAQYPIGLAQREVSVLWLDQMEERPHHDHRVGALVGEWQSAGVADLCAER